ncbi:hypothetical protein [Bacillus sp. FJAT-27445]|uniref:hypothetical protein n=1 Tax=Bacillus sp. FJAT-27445 TaxID=1679166 RepID=UPI0007441B1A|nr:hypothetical protein [Bacillus sp. FJAT-27445]
MGIYFDNLDDVYSAPNFEIKKGSQILLYMYFDGSLKDFDDPIFGTKEMLDWWAYDSENGKRKRPLKLINYAGYENWFKAELLFVKKSQNIDELKLLIQDLMDVYNIEGLRVKKCEVTPS